MLDATPPTRPSRPTNARRDSAVLAVLVLGWVAMAGAPARAGGGPENVILVVNANSAGSKEVANHYVRLRNVPASNVVSLDYKGSKETVSGEVFREQILRPVLKEIDERGLSLQIDMVAYSTDFPWRITMGKDFPEDLKLPRQLEPNASITGATYLFGFVLGKNPGVVSFDSNWYYATAPGQPRQTNSQRCRQLGDVPSRAFRSRYAWGKEGQRSDDIKQGRRYLLSTMLGVTTGRGNSVDEVIASLERAVEAEASPPTGAFYFMRNQDVRSKTRHGCFDSAAEQLRRLGARALVQVGVRPAGADDVAGLVMGSAELKLDKAAMTIQPGAICEHLTSTGGVLFKKSYQTPLTDLIRAGATGSSGTVNEPFAIQAKFPSPMLQVHYRRGSSLAEAFYQSVAGPYQLLIVGDPLCQPWAKRPALVVEGWPTAAATGQIVPGSTSTIGFAELGLTPAPKPAAVEADPAPGAGQDPAGDQVAEAAQAEEAILRFTPKVTPTQGASGTPFWEFFVDGRLRMRLPTGKEVAFSQEQLGPGWHDLRCVGINPDPLEGQRRQEGEIDVHAEGDDPLVRLEVDAPTTPMGGKVAVSASAAGAERIVIRHNDRQVATIDGEEGGALIEADRLGRGPVRLQAVAEPSGAASPLVWTRVE